MFSMDSKYRFGNRIFLFSIIVSISIILGVVILNSSDDSLDNSFRLVKPSFGQISGANFLEQEAGIAAYVKVNNAIDLKLADGVFRGIDSKTSDYIIGSVALPDYNENEDPHVFIHKDGWLIAYYPKNEPVTKIINWNDYDNNKLELALAEVNNVLTLVLSEPSYYHFAYPEANAVIVAADSDTMRVTIPSSMVVYERSIAYVDQTNDSIDEIYKFITFNDLPLDKPNKIEIIGNYRDGNLWINDKVFDNTNFDVNRFGIGLVFKQ